MKGFSLIELLVVVAIIGILAAVGIPQYSEYKKRAFDSVAVSDLRNIALGEEAYFLEQEQYLSCSNASCLNLPGIRKIAAGVNLSTNATATGFTGQANHVKGSGKVFHWDSDKGGLQ